MAREEYGGVKYQGESTTRLLTSRVKVRTTSSFDRAGSLSSCMSDLGIGR